MKIKLTVLGLVATATLASAQIYTTNISTTGGTIADYSPLGLTETFTATDLAGAITNIQVNLNITGGFNGDLYAYLAGPQGQLAILLNRPGVTGSNPYGSGDAGFNITLSELGTVDIHDYAANPGSYTGGGGGQVNGGTSLFLADGRNVDPLSLGLTLFGTSTAANLSLFNGTLGDGTWTLFIADLAPGGGTATLNSAILTIMTVPEPSALVLGAGGLLWLFNPRCRKQNQ
jgi:subtilisin-like proprotein convertase family protein